jgi:sec-independent protein translocase protein TatA
MTPLFAFWGSPMDIAIVLIIGVLLFGKRLPDMGRYLGKSITEFKKGMKGLEDDVDISAPPHTAPVAQTQHAPQQQPEAIRAPQRVAATAPKFEDVPANPPQV